MSYRLVSRLAAAVVACCAVLGPAMASAPFDPNVRELPIEVRLPRWEAALVAIAREEPRLRACLAAAANCDAPRLAAWRRMMLDAAGTSPEAQIDAVNRFVNTVPYVHDIDRFGVVDHWAAPIEFFAGGGDCEDYAIAKYVSLRLLGMRAGDLQIVVLEDRTRRIAHAVLAVRLERGVMVLDNLSDRALALGALPHYAPYYAVNEERRWLHRLPNEPVPAATR